MVVYMSVNEHTLAAYKPLTVPQFYTCDIICRTDFAHRW